MKKDLLAAQRYAQAMFELAHGLREDEYVEAALESLSAALKQDIAVERFLANPALASGEKRRIAERLFSGKKPEIDRLLVNFLLMLFAKNRFYLVHDIAAYFRTIADESQGQGVTEIYSAVSLTQAQRDTIVSHIEKLTGKKMVVRAKVDGDLIGGVLVKVGNKLIDDSVRTKIQNFKKELTKTQSI